MAKKQQINLIESWVEDLQDHSIKGLITKVIGHNTNGTRVEVSVNFSEWTLERLAQQYGRILKQRADSAAKRAKHFESTIIHSVTQP